MARPVVGWLGWLVVIDRLCINMMVLNQVRLWGVLFVNYDWLVAVLRRALVTYWGPVPLILLVPLVLLVSVS